MASVYHRAREKIMSEVSDFKEDALEELKFIHKYIESRGFMRLFFYLIVGIFGLAISALIQNVGGDNADTFRQIGVGLYTAATIFSLHETLHYRIQEFSDISKRISDIVIVSVDILVAIPMFSYGDLSSSYTRNVAIFLTLCGSIWLFGWYLYKRLFSDMIENITKDIWDRGEIEFWKYRVRIASMCFVLLLLPAIFIPSLSVPLSINYISFISFLSILVFIDISHIVYISILLFQYFIPFMRFVARMGQVYSIALQVFSLLLWYLFLEFIYLSQYQDGSTLTAISMALSWCLIGLIFVLPLVKSISYGLKYLLGSLTSS